LNDLASSSKLKDGRFCEVLKRTALFLVGTGRFELPTPRTPSGSEDSGSK
jgi:hypothetical protein